MFTETHDSVNHPLPFQTKIDVPADTGSPFESKVTGNKILQWEDRKKN